MTDADNTKALLALCDKLLSNPNGYNESSLTIAAWAKEQLLSSASHPTEGGLAEIRKRHDDVETLRHASMSQVGGMEHWVISFGMRAHFDRATLLRLLETRTAGAFNQLTQMLRECAETFRRYEQMHRAKGTDDGNAKAYANAALAQRCEDVLASSPPRTDTGVSRGQIVDIIRAHVREDAGYERNGIDITTVYCAADALLALLNEQVKS